MPTNRQQERELRVSLKGDLVGRFVMEKILRTTAFVGGFGFRA